MKEIMKEFEGALLAIIVMFTIFVVAAIISCNFFEEEFARLVVTLGLSYFAAEVMCEKG